MGGTLQSTFTRRKSATLPESVSPTRLRDPQVRVDQALERLDVIAQQLDVTPQVFSTGLVEETFFVSSPDGRRCYAATASSSVLVGYHNDSTTGHREEFCRIRLGLQTGGISSIAVGGTWVFAACGPANRVVVLRLCHDWYQNKTRLLVMRVVDGGTNPTKVVSSKHGSIVSVLYSGESLVRVYRCLANGKLEMQNQFAVPQDATNIELDDFGSSILVTGPFGLQTIELESIFKEIPDLDMVRR